MIELLTFGIDKRLSFCFQFSELSISSPFVFFKSVEKDKNWAKPIWWAIFSAVFYLLMLSLSAPIFSALLLYLTNTFPDWSPLFAGIFIPTSVLSESVIVFSSIVLGIIFLPVTQFIVEKVGGKKPLVQTVKAIYYPAVIGHLLGWIPILNFFVFFWMVFIHIKSLMFFQKLTLEKSVLFLIASTVVELLLIFLFLNYRLRL